MSWLRIDDGFAQHPKLIRLPAKDRWTWMEILCYCARYRTEGIVPAAIGEVVRGATDAYLARCYSLELLDMDGETTCYAIHDWDDFNPKDPTAASRARLRRSTMPDPGKGEWKEARRKVFERDDGICIDCLRDCKTPRDERDAWNADHEPPREQLIEQGISIYDIAYIVTRCASCHAKKTRRQANEKRTTDRTPTERNRDSRVSARARSRPVPLSTEDQRPLTSEEIQIVREAVGRSLRVAL